MTHERFNWSHRIEAADYRTSTPRTPLEMVPNQPKRYIHQTRAGLLTYDSVSREVNSPLRDPENPFEKLTRIEGKLLTAMMENPRKIWSHRELFESVWGELPYKNMSSSDYANLRVRICGVRRKLGEKIHSNHVIHTVAGKGYTLTHPLDIPDVSIESDTQSLHFQKTPYGDITYNSGTRVATSPFFDEKSPSVILTLREGSLLQLFLKSEGSELTKASIAAIMPPACISVYIQYLRRKLNDIPHKKREKRKRFRLIQTVRPGVYRLSTKLPETKIDRPNPIVVFEEKDIFPKSS